MDSLVNEKSVVLLLTDSAGVDADDDGVEGLEGAGDAD